MKFAIERRESYLHAALYNRDTAEEMRQFLMSVKRACREHDMPRILISVRRSRAVFKPEDYGLNGYANEMVTPACQIALVGDVDEVNTAHEYIELVARQQGVNLRAFRDEHAAVHWLQGERAATRRYRFARTVIAGAPDAAGVFTLWDGEEVVYYGRADSIRAALREFLLRSPNSASSYSWEVCGTPAQREAELLREHERAYGAPPRLNGGTA